MEYIGIDVHQRESQVCMLVSARGCARDPPNPLAVPLTTPVAAE